MDSTPKHRTSIIQHVFTLVNSTKVRPRSCCFFAIMSYMLFLPQLLATIAVGLESPPLLSDISAARQYGAEPFDHHVRFDLTGIVEHVDKEKLWFVLSDTTNRVCLTSKTIAPKVRPGDKVRVTGVSERENAYAHRLECKDVSILGLAALPPVREVTIADIFNPENENATVRVRGTVTDACIDEIDRRYRLLTLTAGGKSALVALKSPDMPLATFNPYLGAEVSVTGFCSLHTGIRPYSPAIVSIEGTNAISVLRATASDPFDIPFLTYDWHTVSDSANSTQRHRVDGTVLATWRGNRLILDDGRHHAVMAELAPGETLPPPGTDVTLAGFPTTDFFHINLMSALCRQKGASRKNVLPSDPLPMMTVLAASRNTRFIHPGSHGQLVRLQGNVDSISSSSDSDASMRLNSNGLIIDVYASSCPDSLADIVPGSIVEVDGICVLEAQSWSPEQRFFPHIENCAVVIRNPSDVRVVSRPSWWTPVRLLAVIASLLIIIVAALCWGWWLKRLVERRSRELMREQIAHRLSESRRDDRTRLAVELHDSLSQTLASVAFQISSAKSAKDDYAGIETRLCTAERMLDSCRTELKHCLIDLRSNALEERNLETAIRIAVDNVRCEAEVETSVDISRAGLSDSVAHAILMIVRELVSNAVRHGHAKRIFVKGAYDSGKITLSVSDDGCGFDTANRPGFREGHFGLDGIRQRIKAYNGSISMESTPGRGTDISIQLDLKRNT